MNEPAYDLELRNVSKRFGEVRAVDGVSFAVQKGEFLSLLGPSGCGKTTTLRLIAGFEQPTGGQILLKGESMERTPPNRRDVNTVFQHYALFPHMTVRDNIGYPLAIRRRPKREIDDRVAEVIEIVGLGGHETRFPHQLSGGQQQRVALARALVNRPAVLLLDEPLGALDLLVRKRMQMELKRIHRTLRISFVYVTHDQEEALTLSDRIAVMNHGRIEQIGTPNEVYDRPSSRFVLGFVGASNVFHGVARRADGTVATIEISPGLELAAVVPQRPAPGARVTVAVRPEKILVTDDRQDGNCFRAEIADVIFQGALCQYVVRLVGGSELIVLRQTVEANSQAAQWKPGRSVWVAWPADNCLVFME